MLGIASFLVPGVGCPGVIRRREFPGLCVYRRFWNTHSEGYNDCCEGHMKRWQKRKSNCLDCD